jgi:hypothetical protein
MHPFERWFDASLVPLFRASLVLSLLTMAALGTVDASLRCPTAPLGIVSFELAGGGAADVLEGWSEAQRRDAMLVQGLDYLFLVLYSTALASAALLAGRRARTARPQLAALARPVAWGFTLSGLFDAVENTPMTLMLRTGVADATGAWITLGFASAKFILLLIGIPYLLLMTALGRGQAPGPKRP